MGATINNKSTTTEPPDVTSGATTCDLQQCGILTSVDSDEPVQSPFCLRKFQMIFSQELNSQIIFKRLAKALIRLSVCAGWSEHLLVADTTLLEISCHGSIVRSHLHTRINVFRKEQGGSVVEW